MPRLSRLQSPHPSCPPLPHGGSPYPGLCSLLSACSQQVPGCKRNRLLLHNFNCEGKNARKLQDESQLPFTPVQSVLGFDLLCIGLLQESTPKLTLIRGAEVDQSAVHSGQQVIDPHLLPLAVYPELHTGDTEAGAVGYSVLKDGRLYLGIYSEGEAAFVAVLKALLQRHHLLEQRGVHRQRCDCREQPAVIYGESELGISRELHWRCEHHQRSVTIGAKVNPAETRAQVLFMCHLKSHPWRGMMSSDLHGSHMWPVTQVR